MKPSIIVIIKVVGVGSGSTIVHAVDRLKQRAQEEDLNIRYIMEDDILKRNFIFLAAI